MGTNYYLRKKASYIPREDRSENWWENYDFDFYDSELNHVQELTNGYVFNNAYYPSLEALNKAYFITYHIGKLSAGWRFNLATYPKQNINSLEDWKKLFNDKSTEIYDEYNEKVSKKEMLKKITKLKPFDNSLKNETSYTSSSGEVLEVRNGLIVHPLKYGCIDNSKEETYDILDHWNFS